MPSLSRFTSGLSKCLNPTPTIKHCARLYHSWDVSGRIYPWYQSLQTRRSGWLGLQISVITAIMQLSYINVYPGSHHYYFIVQVFMYVHQSN